MNLMISERIITRPRYWSIQFRLRLQSDFNQRQLAVVADAGAYHVTSGDIPGLDPAQQIATESGF